MQNSSIKWLFCGHAFHAQCFGEVDSCPLCRGGTSGLVASAEDLDEHNDLLQKFNKWEQEELFENCATHKLSESGFSVVILEKDDNLIKVLRKNGATSTMPLTELIALPQHTDASSHVVTDAWSLTETHEHDPKHKDYYIELIQGSEVRLLHLLENGWAEVCFNGLIGWLPFNRLKSKVQEEDAEIAAPAEPSFIEEEFSMKFLAGTSVELVGFEGKQRELNGALGFVLEEANDENIYWSQSKPSVVTIFR